ncbi:hypothetical protein, partial [Hyella patelloides]|uniref:hypothetical protein n=1 Tax=Hyella patelloides TaxID=1982969 RepID=UPI0011A8C0A1
MQSTIFNTPVIKIDSLKNKFDTLVLSGSFITLIGDYIEALFLHQLHYWSFSEYGVVIDDTRWIYKPIREWKNEVFSFLTEWKIRKAIASLLEKGLIERKKLYVKHHEIKHDNPYWNPKNQTYYYSVNYDKLQELIDRVEGKIKAEARPAHGEPSSPSFLAESTENVRIENFTKLSSEEFQDTKYCELSQNNTKNTSIENNSINKSHPHLPCVSNTKEKENSQEKNFSNPEVLQNKEINSYDSAVIEQDTNDGRVEEKINKNTSTNKTNVQEPVQVEAAVLKPKPKTPKGTKPNRKRRNEAPWETEGQFKRFYRALIQALPIVANARSAPGLAQVIIKQLRSGIPHTYWDDFAAGLPIGTSDKPEWEVEPGVPYPQFFEYLTEKIIKGNNTQTNEQARNEVFRILDKPRQAKAFWGQFKRSVVNISEQVERDRALGVSNPNTPVWTRERIEPSIEEAAAAGEKIMAVNGATNLISPGERLKVKGKREQQEPFLPTSTSLDKSEEVSPSSDPWSDRPTDTDCDKPNGMASLRDERQPT